MANQKLEDAVKAIGGVVAAAYHTGRSVQTVYGWYNAGRIFDAQDLLTIHTKAAEVGFTVTLEELAGMDVQATTPEPSPTGTDDLASRRRTYTGPTAKKHAEKDEAATVASLRAPRKKKGCRSSSTPRTAPAAIPVALISAAPAAAKSQLAA